jgi:ParB-like chromosome segregation protein Spo0J
MSSLTVESWSIERFKPYGANPRKNDAVIDKMVASITEFGFRVPIVAKSDGLVVDGHLRLKAAKKMGMAEVPVVLADELSDTQVKAFRLLANKSANWAHWDNELLRQEIQALDTGEIDLAMTGFDEDEIKEILGIDTTTVDDPLDRQYCVLIPCDSKARQQVVFEKLQQEGYHPQMGDMKIDLRVSKKKSK